MRSASRAAASTACSSASCSSFLPLLVVAYAVAVWQYSPNKLTTYQVITMILGGAATVVDVFLFSWLTFRNSRGLTLKERRAAG